MTHEFYQEARQRLNPGGVLASFVAYSKRPSQQLFLRTFLASFRHVIVIRGHAGMYLVGSQAPLNFRAAAIRQVFGSRAAQADLAGAPDFSPVPVTSWPSIIHQRLWLTGKQVGAYAGSGPLLTDNHPLSEYFLIHDFGLRSARHMRFERSSLQLALAVTGLLCLLAIGVVLAALRGRLRSPSGTPGAG
jgi:hypothetical protein